MPRVKGSTQMYLSPLPGTGSSATTPRSRRPIGQLHGLTPYPLLRPERTSHGNAPANIPGHRRSARRTVPAVEMVDLCKHFGTLRAVDHLSLSVEPGEIFGLLGPNGSGKTTIINMLSGLSVATSGQVHVLGYDVRRNAQQIRHLLGAVPKETALYEELSAWDNLDFHADLFGVPRREKKARIIAILELGHLLDRKHSRANTFSGGMKG